MLPEHGDPPACEFCDDTGKFNGRSNRRKPLSEFNSELHVGLSDFQQLCLKSPFAVAEEKSIPFFEPLSVIIGCLGSSRKAVTGFSTGRAARRASS
jgi:hypothetical protein